MLKALVPSSMTAYCVVLITMLAPCGALTPMAPVFQERQRAEL
jgi:hypothetical protein